jgi:hypothetical protein
MRENTRRITIENEASLNYLNPFEYERLSRETTVQPTHTYTGDLVRQKAAEIVRERKK